MLLESSSKWLLRGRVLGVSVTLLLSYLLYSIHVYFDSFKLLISNGLSMKESKTERKNSVHSIKLHHLMFEHGCLDTCAVSGALYRRFPTRMVYLKHDI